MRKARLAVLLFAAWMGACSFGPSEYGGIEVRLEFPAHPETSPADFRRATLEPEFVAPDTVVLSAVIGGRSVAQGQFPYASGRGELAQVPPDTYRVVAEGRLGNRTIYRGHRDGVVVEAGRMTDAGLIEMTPVELLPPVLDGAPPAVTNVAKIVLSGTKQTATGILLNGSVAVEPDQSTNFSVSATLREGANTLSLASIDGAGAESEILNITVRLDTQPPLLRSVSLAGGAAAVSTTTVALLVNAEGASQLQMAENGLWHTGQTVAFNTSVVASLSSRDGTKALHVRALDDAGNASLEKSVSVRLDRTPPARPGVSIIGNPLTPAASLLLDVTANEASAMQISMQPSFQGAAWQGFEAQPSFTPSGEAGLVAVYVRVRDSAGNASAAGVTSALFSQMVLAGLAPQFGLPGTVVTLTGSGFGTAQGSAQVWIGNAVTDALTWSDTSISLEVPKGVAPGFIPVLLQRNEALSNSLPFENRQPWIDARYPRHVDIGTPINLYGRFLGTGMGTVYDAGMITSAYGWSATGVELSAPVGTPGPQAITLETEAGQVSNSIPIVHRGSDVWVGLGDTPEGRSEHSAVWTGTEMIVWGGDISIDNLINTGGRYNPTTDTWLPVTRTGAPSSRKNHTAVWSGREMIIWGGVGYTQAGGRYDPQTDSWKATSMSGAPEERTGHTAVWTGTEMIIWGGYNNFGTFQNGARYDPRTDTWTGLSATGAPATQSGHVAVWTGREMIVWGGGINAGALYDPVADSWRAMSGSGAPSARDNATAVWTGREMIVWGGEDDQATVLADGARYFPATDQWSALSASPLDGRVSHSAIWTGAKMVLWGGGEWGGSDGAVYDPATDSWTHAVSQAGSPSVRKYHTAIWTGSEMLVWGGTDKFTAFNTGSRYDLDTDSWMPIAGVAPGTPSPREGHSAIWTGSEMIVWGGESRMAGVSGARYNPTIDAWYPVSATGPGNRKYHSAVWTGTEMLVWGGCVDAYGCSSVLDDGGRYHPSTDTWTTMSQTNAPEGRAGHVTVWSGQVMLVWGGTDTVAKLGSGGAYDPLADAWTTISTTGAPTPREESGAVWTGSELLLWGGYSVADEATGAKLSWPANLWSPMAVTGAPSPRRAHAAVWTGSKMFVFGGVTDVYPNELFLADGALYDPLLNVWTTVSATGAPGGRASSAAFWTGTDVIVWGGQNSRYTSTSSGALYDPELDSWSPMGDGLYRPASRPQVTGVFTGSEMIIWGGGGSWSIDSGAIYIP